MPLVFRVSNSVVVLSVLIHVLIVVSVARDAKRHGAPFVLWGLVTFFFPLVGAAGWLLYRNSGRLAA